MAPVVAATVERLGSLIAAARRILIFTGAGISTASGIPDYRGPQGVWNTRRPIDYADFMGSIEVRREAWRIKMDGWVEFATVQPNIAHHAVVELEGAGKIEAVVTQNIDGLHAAAGTSAERLIEIHGTGRLIACQSCGERTDPGPHFDRFRETGEPPTCHCGGILKSATISFGQNLDPDDLNKARLAASSSDLVMALGSSLVVYPAADIPLHGAAGGAPYVIVNRGPTDHDRHPLVSLRIDGDVTEVVPAAVRIALD